MVLVTESTLKWKSFESMPKRVRNNGEATLSSGEFQVRTATGHVRRLLPVERRASDRLDCRRMPWRTLYVRQSAYNLVTSLLNARICRCLKGDFPALAIVSRCGFFSGKMADWIRRQKIVLFLALFYFDQIFSLYAYGEHSTGLDFITSQSFCDCVKPI